MLVPVIMAGGVGSRLWPASREAYPKQFLCFGNDADGNDASLFQQSLQRLDGLDMAPPIVVCNSEHRFLVAEQLRQLNVEGATIVLEPVGRNTAPAVALAALAAQKRSPDACLLVLAADHVIAREDVFRAAVVAGQAAADRGELVTFGIVPTRAETGYGYIKAAASDALANNAMPLLPVERFVEKPDLPTAQAYVDSGDYYWNSGMFLFRASRYLDELGTFEPDILRACTEAWNASKPDLDFTRVAPEPFAACPSKSIDYAVMEKTQHAVVVPLDAGWNDLGAWSSVWEHTPRDEAGNVSRGDVLMHDTTGSFVQAESRLVAMVGMDDTVVVETSDAVLVAAKDRVQDVKEIVRKLAELKRTETVLHKKVYRPWGSYEGLCEAAGFQVKRIVVNPGAALSLQLHHKRSEHWIVVQGMATVTCGTRTFELFQNQSTYIPLETPHRLENRTPQPLVLIEVQCGGYLGEDDIVRLEDVYGR
ncbi:MAG: mannose-1-phosphate guanylyltransferase/mannose-6-phosphate isomerase [Pseudomonadota bacterium]|nr:mannose-1-phosphate guanylyltransferase/mannose-6-phosphate isomerase [Pseudomonadota bacterium]